MRAKYRLILAIVFLLAVCAPGLASAQGSIVGVVTAPDDARLPGVVITVTNLASRAVTVVVTANHGGFSVSNLPPAEYEIKAELPGFETQTIDRVRLIAGESREVSFKLPLSTLRETVMVVGAVIKSSVEVSEIRESTARDIGEALGRLNGINKVRKGAIGNDIVLQGFQSRNLTVLIDGERINGACPNGMDPAVFHADFAEVDHLDVSKGPFDMRHQGSLGGVVNVVTLAPGQGFHANLNLSLGAYHLINPSVTASYGTNRISALGGFSFRAADPYRDGAGNLFTSYANYRPDTVAARAYQAMTGWGRLFYAPGTRQTVQAAYTQQRATHVDYPYLLMDGVTDTADRLNTSYQFLGDEASRIKSVSVRAYYSRVRHWMTDQWRVSSIGAAREYSMATQADTSTYGGTIEAGIGNFTAGIEVFRRNWDGTTYMAGSQFAPQYAIPFVSIDNAGAFVEYQQQFGASTRLDLGARFDWSHSAADPTRANTNLYFAYKNTRETSATDTGPSGKIRVIHKFGSDVELEAGLGHTFRVPDPQERYYALKRMGQDWVGDPLLPPTTNTGVNIGVNYRFRRVMASVGVIHSWLSNYIALQGQTKINVVPGVMNSFARSYTNVNGQMTSGEVSLTWPLTDRLFATANAAYTRGTKSVDPARGITSPNMPEIHPVMGAVRLRYDRAIVFAEGEMLFSGKHVYVDTDLQEEPMPGYALLNLRVGADIKRFRVTLALDNVFNELYVDHMSYQRDPFRIGVRVREPGRNLYTNISYRF